MVVHVVEEGAHVLVKQRRVGVEQFRVLVAQGQGGLFELEVAVAQLLNLAARVAAVGRREQSGFQVVEVAVQFGDERGVVGRDAVEKYAEQVVRRAPLSTSCRPCRRRRRWPRRRPPPNRICRWRKAPRRRRRRDRGVSGDRRDAARP